MSVLIPSKKARAAVANGPKGPVASGKCLKCSGRCGKCAVRRKQSV